MQPLKIKNDVTSSVLVSKNKYNESMKHAEIVNNLDRAITEFMASASEDAKAKLLKCFERNNLRYG